MRGGAKDEVNIFLQKARKLIKGEVDSPMLGRFDQPSPTDTSRMIRELQNKSVLNTKRVLVSTDSSIITDQPSQTDLMLQSYAQDRQLLNSSDRAYQSKHSSQHSNNTEKLREKVARYRREQQETHQLIADYLHRFDECRNRMLPTVEINRECFRNRDLRDNEEFLWSVKSTLQPIEHLPSFKNEYGFGMRLQDESTGEYTDEDESEQQNQLIFYHNREIFLKGLLQKNEGRFLKIFSAYLLEIIKKQDSIANSKLNTPEIRHEVYPLLESSHKRYAQQVPSTILFDFSQIYQIEYRPIPSITGSKFFAPEVVAQRVANKRSGSSMIFHPRTFVLSGHQMLYYGDSDKNVKKMKVIIPQLLELTTVEKEIGGFFSREKKTTKMFTIRGEERSLQVEHSYLYGAEMYRYLCYHFSLKAYNSYCCDNEIAESRFQEFIRSNECYRLDLANDLLKVGRGKVSLQLLAKFMGIWMKGVELNKKLRYVNLRRSRLPQECLYVVLGKLEMELPNLAALDMSGNPLTVNCLRTYYSCLKEMTELTSMNLSDCGITDGVMEDVFRELPSIAYRLLHINLSHNNITHQSMPLLLKVLQRLQLAEFVADGLPLGNSSVSQFLSDGIEISSLSMNGCRLNLDDTVVSGIATKLSKNIQIRRLSLQQNTCTISRETFRAMLKDSKSLYYLQMDIPKHYLFAEEDPTNEWTVDYLL